MKPRVETTHAPEETRRLGEAIGKTFSGGEVVALIGGLGTGKTTLVQGIAKGAGVPNAYIPSPTFALINTYTGIAPFHHIDLYRLEKRAQVEELGLLDLFSEKAIAVIEWAELAEDLLPEERLTLTLTELSETDREIVFSAKGERYVQLVKNLAGGAD